MRLLCSTTLELEEFNDSAVPPYAILSHTWRAGEEVTLMEMQQLSSRNSNKDIPLVKTGSYSEEADLRVVERSGYLKVKRFCELAAKDGFEYAWVDTCCIDKMSSSELSEAINSMWRWYQRAEICYVYLSDVVPDKAWDCHSGRWDPMQLSSSTRAAFASSKWFTRGWTLQELIAPASVIFFNKDWQDIGTKSSLKHIISEVTGIQVEVLLGINMKRFSVAQRMSWASKRETTRLEDSTYCLMGIFGVNMPMLYGEGHRAFRRLQEEIIRNSDDHSILAWSDESLGYATGLLAPSPAAFANSGNVVEAYLYPISPMSIKLTNRGVHVLVEPASANDGRPHMIYACILNCEEFGKPNERIVIYLQRQGVNDFHRVNVRIADTGRCWSTVKKLKVDKRAPQFLSTEYWQDSYVPHVHHKEIPALYESVYVEMDGFHGMPELYPKTPDDGSPLPSGFDGERGLIKLMHEEYSRSEIAALRFPSHVTLPGIEEDCVVLLYRQRDKRTVLFAKIFMISSSKSLTSVVVEHVIGGNLRGDTGDLDRVAFQHQHLCVRVAIKRKMIYSERRFVVEISYVDFREGNRQLAESI